MRQVSSVPAVAVLVCLVLLATVGCPKQPNYSLALLVSSTSLDFGTSETTKTFTVSKVNSSRPMAPITVTNGQPWLTISSIDPPSRVSSGPKDYITVTLTADRTKMTGGLNTATIVVSSLGVVPVTITVTATLQLKADFKANTTTRFVGESVQFQDLSKAAASEGPILSWLWDFGDGNTSTLQNPSHVYTYPGTYTVKLTVTTANSQDMAERVGYITVSTVSPPRADFTYSPAVLDINVLVRFTDLSQAGSLPITKWSWNFGDGIGTSEMRNPTYTYTQPGSYNVILRVTAGPDVASVTKTLSVTVTPPVADFSVDDRKPTTGQTLHFTDLSRLGSGTVATSQWAWNFGDPTVPATNTSTLRNPSKVYNTAGNYSVSLTVTTPYGTDNETKAQYIRVFQETALDRYVKAADTYFSSPAQQTNTFSGTGFTATTFELTSQAWRLYTEVDQPLWKHQLTIIKPTATPSSASTALLYVKDGTATDLATPPTSVSTELSDFAVATKAPVAVLTLVPYQPIKFTPSPALHSEDDLIAASMGKYLDGGDENWPVLLPMTKAVVKGMNVTRDQLSQLSGGTLNINRFVIAGAAKRGWVTWLTAAVDSRVIAIAPMVFDGLNLGEQLRRHYQAYGAYDSVWTPYNTYNVIPRLKTTTGLQLLSCVDPINYVSRLDIPKLMINNTGDRYFLPDAAQSYWGGLLDVKHLRYYRGNALESATATDPTGYEGTVGKLVPWFQAVTSGATLPTVNWTNSNNTLTVQTSTTPSSVVLWQATANSRDFRSITAPSWSQTPVAANGANTYPVTVVAPGAGQYKAYFVEVQFTVSTSTLPYIFTTQVYVTPDTLPFPAPAKSLEEADVEAY